ncbi:hypothetical protein B4166_1999 [Caldibacillus thermoamylovorans]|uniref:Uncharacterized protein n=1 Tax=Caldibacillus thermoamylovorans TaxID=35841 RepID=A0ABD4A4I0_9BACI|nr:hypothetical protein B4166_1999 [Caldibacillus thermoamylovorans]KIO71891.1 hypothetical protein B4167_3251 [Caldibacillus thermoamylovorans]
MKELKVFLEGMQLVIYRHTDQPLIPRMSLPAQEIHFQG